MLFSVLESADPEGGGVQNPPPPPWDLSRGGVLCRGLMGRRGGPTVVFTLLLTYFWGPLRSPILYKHITYIYVLQAQCSVWNGHPFSIFPLSKLWQESNLQSLAFRAFSYFSCLELHDFIPFKLEIFWRRTPAPIPNTFTLSNLPCHLCICVERDLPCLTPRKQTCMQILVWKIDLTILKKGKSHNSPPYFSLPPPF